MNHRHVQAGSGWAESEEAVGSNLGLLRVLVIRTLALLTRPGEPNWEPTTLGTGPRQATSSHYHRGRTARQATPSAVQARFESAS